MERDLALSLGAGSQSLTPDPALNEGNLGWDDVPLVDWFQTETLSLSPSPHPSLTLSLSPSLILSLSPSLTLSLSPQPKLFTHSHSAG